MFRIVRPWERGLIEFLGKYNRTAGSGLAIVLPFFERMRKIDMREQVVDVPPQAVITKDNVVVEVDAVVYYEVVDPVKVAYKVANFYAAVTKLAQTSLRNLIGDLALDESLTSREVINTRLRQILDEATDKWGVNVTRVELQRIEPPADVTQAMHRQMKAERDRRATILEAEGFKQAEILKAEGRKQSAVLEAEGKKRATVLASEGEAEARQKVAQGEAAAIRAVYTAIQSQKPTQELITIKYLDTLSDMATGEATKIFLPYEATGILGSLGGIGELLKKEDGGS